MKKFLLILVLSYLSQNIFAQFPPAAGMEGTTAIHKDSSIFIAWAKTCSIERGYLDISSPDSGFVDFGSLSNAVGQADLNIISLGDGGIAILEFEKPIINGEGADFAIFENSFSDVFLELALVYVSSNGLDYDVFPAVSLTQTEIQIEGFGNIDATKIHNLAGKYRAAYGTPFDLYDIEYATGKTINQITHIKIVDVVGSIIDDYASYDSQLNIINDPYPTPFPSGGFDLDAVGVIHQATAIQEPTQAETQILIYPNPSHGSFKIKNTNAYKIESIEIYNLYGQIVDQLYAPGESMNQEFQLPRGRYYVRINGGLGSYTELLLVF